MSGPIALAVFGAGWIAEHGYLPHLRGSNRFRVTRVVDSDIERARSAAAFFGATPVLPGDWSPSEGEGVIVCSPPATHLPVILRCLRAGSWVLCEKPVIRTRAEAEALAAAGTTRLMGSATMRFREDIGQLFGWLHAGFLGKLRRTRLSWSRAQGVPSPGSWRTDLSAAPWGVLEDLGPHLLDLAVSLVDEEEPCVLDALLECRFGAGERAASWFAAGGCAARYETPDTCQARLVIRDIEVEIAACWACEATGDQCDVVIEGDRATAVFRGLFGFSVTPRSSGSRCILRRGGEVAVRTYFEGGPGAQRRAFERTVARFAAFCRGEEPPVASAREVLRTTRWMDAIARASRRTGEAT